MAKDKETQLGVVIVFRKGMSRLEAKSVVAALMAANNIDPSQYIGGVPPVNEFNPEAGGPVWYCP